MGGGASKPHDIRPIVCLADVRWVCPPLAAAAYDKGMAKPSRTLSEPARVLLLELVHRRPSTALAQDLGVPPVSMLRLALGLPVHRRCCAQAEQSIRTIAAGQEVLRAA